MSAYFFVGSLIPQGDFSQLTLIPDLFEHFEVHQIEARAAGEEITFLEFLTEHYIDTEGHDHDGEDEHPCMPMQQMSSGFQYLLIDFDFPMSEPTLQDSQRRSMTSVILHSSDYARIMDRPPSLI